MSDPKLQSIGAQLSALSTQIQTESVTRATAYEALASRVTASEAAIAAVKLQVDAEALNRFGENILLERRLESIEKTHVGPVQSSNYVPGVSGWKLNHDGTFEISSCTLGSAAKAPERQMVSVEVASWSKYDLPKNAANLLQFMQAELQKVPEQYRHAAEFEEFDASYGDESFNARLFLSYSRLETEEELADRLAKAKLAGTRVSINNGLMTVTHNGVVRFKLGKLDQSEPEQPQPFKVQGDQVFINEAAIKDGMIVDPARFGITKDGQTELEKALASGDASAILELLASKIDETRLGQELKERIDGIGSGQVNKRLDELKEKQGAENRAVAERLDSLTTKLGELQTLIGQVKDSAATQAKREMAEALLRDLEADKSGGTLSDCIRRFGGTGVPFSGYTGHIPLKR